MVACRRPRPFSVRGLVWTWVCSGKVTPWHSFPDTVPTRNAIMALTSTTGRLCRIIFSSTHTRLCADRAWKMPWGGRWLRQARLPTLRREPSQGVRRQGKVCWCAPHVALSGVGARVCHPECGLARSGQHDRLMLCRLSSQRNLLWPDNRPSLSQKTLLSFPDVPKMQTLIPLKSHKREVNETLFAASVPMKKKNRYRCAPSA